MSSSAAWVASASGSAPPTPTFSACPFTVTVRVWPGRLTGGMGSATPPGAGGWPAAAPAAANIAHSASAAVFTRIPPSRSGRHYGGAGLALTPPRRGLKEPRTPDGREVDGRRRAWPEAAPDLATDPAEWRRLALAPDHVRLDHAPRHGPGPVCRSAGADGLGAVAGVGSGRLCGVHRPRRIHPRQVGSGRTDALRLLPPCQRHPAPGLGCGLRLRAEDGHQHRLAGDLFLDRRHRAVLGLPADDGGDLMSVVRSPLGRARGLGSSKHGVGHFIAQRTTAVALVLLVLWALASVASLANGDYDTAAAWLRSPINAGLACLLAFAAFWHAQLGIRTIVEDYFAKPLTKAILLILNVFLCWAAGALTILSILKVALSASGVSV